MADALKDFFSPSFVQNLARDFKTAYAEFDDVGFCNDVMDSTWDGLELKARMRHITLAMGKHLPDDYAAALSLIDKVVVHQGDWLKGFSLFFPDFVEIFGIELADELWDLSMTALARYTAYGSSEFAVRPFIIRHEERMMAQMLAWSKSDCEHVRRLSSEGCRPALPWAQALPKFKKDPSPILPILENLKNDPEFYVRKSVANNLNDISKTHPELVIEICTRWQGETAETDWVIKHACRTLLKKGNAAALELFGFGGADKVEVFGIALDQTHVQIGEALNFSFEVNVLEQTKLRLEYAIDFVKSNGKQSRKIFQISESHADADQKNHYVKKHSFADLSTRKHYAGTHKITLIANGKERGSVDFEVF